MNYIDLDLTIATYKVNSKKIWDDELSLLNQLKGSIGFKIINELKMVFGLSLNVYVSKANNGSELYFSKVYNYDSKNTYVRSWIGYFIGLKL